MPRKRGADPPPVRYKHRNLAVQAFCGRDLGRTYAAVRGVLPIKGLAPRAAVAGLPRKMRRSPAVLPADVPRCAVFRHRKAATAPHRGARRRLVDSSRPGLPALGLR